MRPNPELLKVQKRLQREYDLKYAEAEMLADDVLVNLETIRNDLARFFEAEQWDEIAAAGQALEDLGLNLQHDELRHIGAAFGGAAAAADATAVGFVEELQMLLSGLTDAAN